MQSNQLRIDVFRLVPTEHLSQAEIDAAELVHFEQFNAQLQPKVTWPAAVPVARAYLEQMLRSNRILSARAESVAAVLDRADRGAASSARLNAVAAQLEGDVEAIHAGTLGGDAERMEKLAAVLRRLGG